MRLALRPYVTTGVAIVGASVLVAAPITPTPPDIQISMPAESVAPTQRSAEVELASLITDLLGAFNELSVAVGQGIGGGYSVADPPVAPTNGVAGWIGVLPTLTLASLQAALDNPRNIPGLASYNIYALLSAPTNPLVGDLRFPPPLALPPQVNPFPYPVASYSLFVNALAPIIAALEDVLPGPLSDALAHFSEVLGEVIARGLAILPDPVNPYVASVSSVSTYKSADASAAMMVAPRPIEDGVNDLVFAATAVAVSIAQLATPLVARILDIQEPEAEVFLALGTIGLLGPLIGGTGGFGHALQDLVGSENLEQFLSNSLDLVGLPIDGAVNGGPDFGPDLQPLINAMFPPTYAGGLINPGNLFLTLPPWTAPGAIPTLQGLIEQLLGSNMMAASSAKLASPGIPDADLGDVLAAARGAANSLSESFSPESLERIARRVIGIAQNDPRFLPAALVEIPNSSLDVFEEALAPVGGAVIGTLPEKSRVPAARTLAGVTDAIDDVQNAVRRIVTPRATVTEFRNADSTGPEVAPKKERPRVLLNVLKSNPLQLGADEDGAKKAGASDTGRHRIGTPVRDLINKVVNGGKDKGDKDDKDDDSGDQADAE